MPITYTSNPIKIRQIIPQLHTRRLSIPEHQRAFCWSIRQQKKLIDAIQRGKPVPSILRRELENGSHSLEDGHQRFECTRRYLDDGFPDTTGRFFSELTPLERERFETYEFVVMTYSGASDEEAREIFNDIQGGRPLTFGERILSLGQTAPIVRYAIRMLLTPGEGLYDSIAPFWGTHTPRGGRGKDTATAFALCAGLAFGIESLSKKWDDAVEVLHRDFDEVVVTRRLTTIVEIYTRVMATTHLEESRWAMAQYWDPGTFTGYIAMTLLMLDDPAFASSVTFTLPDRETVIERWVEHLIEHRTRPGLLYEILHRDLSAARSWNKARWANGVRRLFAPTVGGVIEDSGEEDDA